MKMDVLERRRRTHHSNMEAETDGQDLINLLPEECTQTIFTFLPSARDRCACAAVSKKWLVLLAHMRGSEFNSFRLASRSIGLARATADREASRCLEADEASDARLAAMAVGTYSRRLLGRLAVRGGPPSPAQTRLTDFGLQIVSHSFPNLRSLALWNCFKVGSSGLASIAECCRALEKLDISNAPKIDDDGLVPIAKNCLNLSALSIDSCPLVGNRSLEALGMCSSHLESISIAKCPQVGDVGIVSMVSHLPNLTRVRLAQLKLGDATLEAIGRHRGSIKVLSLESLAGLTMAGLSWVRLIPKLEVLCLSSCAGLTGMGLTAPTTFGALREVSIRRCGYLKNEGLVGLTASTHQLKALKIERCDGITDDGVTKAIGNCRRTLKLLSLTRCNGLGYGSVKGTDESKDSGGGSYPLLDSLEIKHCEAVEDEFLSRLAPMCSQVNRIELVGLTRITDRGMFSLLRWVNPSGMTAAASVNLCGCVGVTDWTVLTVVRAFGGRLESLGLEGCREVGDRSMVVVAEACSSGLKEVDVSGSRVTDKGVASVAMAPGQRLKVLSLGACEGITDAGLGCVEAMCGGLIGLNVQGCRGITREGVESLRTTLWWCDLLY